MTLDSEKLFSVCCSGREYLSCASARMPFESFLGWVAQATGLQSSEVENAFWTIVVGAICAAACALVGCFLVLRRMSLLGDALSHSVLAGTAGVYLLTGRLDPIPMLLGALVAGVLTSVLTQLLRQAASVPDDASIGIVFTCMFAFGVVIVSRAKNVHLDLDCVLFGDLTAAGIHLESFRGWLIPHAFGTLIPALCLTILFLTVFWKELRLTSFDPTLAVTLGFSASLMHYLLTTVVAVVTVSAMEVVGLLVVALLIVPAATARMLTDRLSTTLWLSCLLSVSCTTIGYLLALRWESSAAGLTAVVAGAELVTAILLGPKYGLFGRLVRTVRLKVRIAAEDILATLFRHWEKQPHPQTASASSADCVRFAGNGLPGRLAMKWLVRRALLRVDGQTAYLTQKGQKYAQSLVRSHRLWESYLQQYFDLPEDHLHDPAEAMEHFIGPKTQRHITEVLDAPEADPHGRRIPHLPEPTDDKALTP